MYANVLIIFLCCISAAVSSAGKCQLACINNSDIFLMFTFRVVMILYVRFLNDANLMFCTVLCLASKCLHMFA